MFVSKALRKFGFSVAIPGRLRVGKLGL